MRYEYKDGNEDNHVDTKQESHINHPQGYPIYIAAIISTMSTMYIYHSTIIND